MNPQSHVDEIKATLNHVVQEEDLLKCLSDRIGILRQMYRADRGQFTSEVVAFLASLKTISARLEEFIDLRQELAEVETSEQYEAMAGTLTAIGRDLEVCAVHKRVQKEIRQLHENLPRIMSRQVAREQDRIRSRIIDLEQSAPHCRRGHLMVVRKGRGGYFWGCSEFPHCMTSKRIATTVLPRVGWQG
jgi:hypothetical protein